MCVLSQLVFDIGLRKVKLIWCVPEHLTLTSRQDKYLGYCQCHRKLGIMSMLYKAIDLSWRFVLKYLLNSSVRSKGSDAASRGRCIGTGISALLRSPGESSSAPQQAWVCVWRLLGSARIYWKLSLKEFAVRSMLLQEDYLHQSEKWRRWNTGLFLLCFSSEWWSLTSFSIKLIIWLGRRMDCKKKKTNGFLHTSFCVSTSCPLRVSLKA